MTDLKRVGRNVGRFVGREVCQGTPPIAEAIRRLRPTIFEAAGIIGKINFYLLYRRRFQFQTSLKRLERAKGFEPAVWHGLLISAANILQK